MCIFLNNSSHARQKEDLTLSLMKWLKLTMTMKKTKKTRNMAKKVRCQPINYRIGVWQSCLSFYLESDGFIEEDHDDSATGAAAHNRHLDLDRRRREVEDMDDEQMADFYDKKYGGRNRVQSFKGGAEDVPQQLLLPSVNDPNLWMIKCKV
jgi:hypothetical protein